jgi:hypothetical protein
VISQIPQPDPVPLPAPAWLLWALLMVTLFLHLVPMNLVLGGSILGAIARVRARRGGRPHDAALAHLVAKAMPVLISAAVSLGVAALLFLQVLYGRLFFPSAIVMGWWWLAVIGLLILAYYAAYLLAFREQSLGGVGTLLAWVIAGVVGLIALVYGNNMTMMLKPQELVARYAADGRGIQLNLFDPTLLPRHVHMLLGALAVSALAVAVAGVVRRRADPAFGEWAVKYGALVCGFATSVNVFAGLWWIAALPRDVLVQFMRGGLGIVGVLLAGIVLTIASAAHLMLAAGGRKAGVNVGAAAGSMLAGLALMLVTRDAVRSASLSVAGFRPVAWTEPQWGPITIFLVLLAAAAATVWWMVRALVKAS